MSAYRLGRFHDLFIRGVGSAITDVFHHGAREEVGVLQYHGDVGAQLLPLVGADVHAVDGDCTLVNVVEAVEEVGDGGLARARRADEGDLLACVGVEAHVLQHRLPGDIAEGDVVQNDLALHVIHGDGVGGVGGLGGFVHDGKDALRACQRREDGGHLHGQVVDGEGELTGVGAEDGQTAHVKAREYAEQTAHARRDGEGEIGQVVHDGAHDAAVEVGLELLVAHIVVQGLELLHADLLVVEDLDHLGARDGLLDVAVDGTQGRLLGHVVLGGLLTDQTAAEEVQRHEQQGQNGQKPAGVEHHEHRTHQGNGARDEAGDGGVDHHVDGVHVVGEAGHQLARGVGIEVADGEPLELSEQIVADLLHGVLGDGDHEASLQVGGDDAREVDGGQHHEDDAQTAQSLLHRGGGVGHQIGHKDPQKDALGVGRDLTVGGDGQHVVDVAEEVGADHGGQGTPDHAEEYENETEPMGADVAHKTARRGAAVLGLALGTGGAGASAGATATRAAASGHLAHGGVTLLKLFNTSGCHYSVTSPLLISFSSSAFCLAASIWES